MTALATIQKMIESLEDCLMDAEKHDRGTDAAGARVRKQLMETKKACDVLRKQIQEDRNTRKG
jgi:hypothetical protein